MTILAATKTSFPLTLHQGFAQSLLIYSAILCLWGLFLWVRGSNPSGGYLGALVILEGLAIVQSAVGLILLFSGHRPHDGIHYLYGVVAVATPPVAYFMSAAGKERNDSGIFAMAALFMIGVALRGISTGGG